MFSTATAVIFEVGDIVWAVDRAIAVRCTISDEYDGEYEVDELFGRKLSIDEIFETKGEAIDRLLESFFDDKEILVDEECLSFRLNESLDSFRTTNLAFVERDADLNNEPCPKFYLSDKEFEEEWFNVSMALLLEEDDDLEYDLEEDYDDF
jgi:hypothetical protein